MHHLYKLNKFGLMNKFERHFLAVMLFGKGNTLFLSARSMMT